MAPPDQAAGTWPAPSTTARPAEKGASIEGLDPALVRRAVDALVTLSVITGRPMRRANARKVVLAYASDNGPELDGWSHWLRNWLGIADATGEAAVRSADQGAAR